MEKIKFPPQKFCPKVFLSKPKNPGYAYACPYYTILCADHFQHSKKSVPRVQTSCHLATTPPPSSIPTHRHRRHRRGGLP